MTTRSASARRAHPVEVVEIIAGPHRGRHEGVDARGVESLGASRGRSCTRGASGGWSHSKVTPTTSSPAPTWEEGSRWWTEAGSSILMNRWCRSPRPRNSRGDILVVPTTSVGTTGTGEMDDRDKLPLHDRAGDRRGGRAPRRRPGAQAALERPPPLQCLHRRARWRAVEQSSDDGEGPGTGGPPILRRAPGRELAERGRGGERELGGVHARHRWPEPGVRRRDPGRARRGRILLQELCEVSVDIAAVGELEHEFLHSRGARVLGVEYTGEASLEFAIPPRARGVAGEIIAELTSGTAELRVIGEQWVDSEVQSCWCRSRRPGGSASATVCDHGRRGPPQTQTVGAVLLVVGPVDRESPGSAAAGEVHVGGGVADDHHGQASSGGGPQSAQPLWPL